MAFPSLAGLPGARRLTNAALSLIFPPLCAHCEKVLDVEEVGPQLCDDCRRAVFTPPQVGCPRCGAIGIRIDAAEGKCLECRDKRLAFDRVFSLGKYDGALQAAIVRMKYEHGQSLAAAVGGQLAVLLGRNGHTEHVDLITCIPKYWLKQLVTGVNSAEIIMSGVAKQANLPSASNLLVCQRKINKQAMLSPEQRWRNVKGAWSVSSGYDITSARILLVDDTMTTGATANSAAKALKQAGAARVTIAVVGRAQKVQ